MADADDRQMNTPKSDCPGLSYTDMLKMDTREVPQFLMEESQVDLGTEPLSTERYTSAEYAALENEKMWPNVWQFAAREEDFPNPGDTIVFDNAGKSYLIVRQDDGSVKAFYNVCLHRGRRIRSQSGNASELKCPFHGFSWKRDGGLKNIPCAWDFEHLDKNEMALPELRVEQWHGFVMISEKQDIAPFRDWLGPASAHWDSWNLDECYTAIWVGRVLNCNWKVAAEAFMEAFHSVTTHPQILPFTGDANTRYDLYDDHVNRAITPSAVASPHVVELYNQNVVLDKLNSTGGRRALEGSDFDMETAKKGLDEDDPVLARKLMAENNRHSFGASCGRDFSDISDSEMIDSFTYNIFPNFAPWGGFVPNLVYRWTTGKDQDHCMMEIRVLKRAKKGEPKPQSAKMFLVPDDEPFAAAGEVMGKLLAAVFDQDLGNMPEIQAGLKASKNKQVHLATYQESRIRHFADTLEKYLAEY